MRDMAGEGGFAFKDPTAGAGAKVQQLLGHAQQCLQRLCLLPAPMLPGHRVRARSPTLAH